MAEQRDTVVGMVATIVGMTLVVATRAVRPLAEPMGPITSVLLGSQPNLGAGLAMPFVITNTQRLSGRRPAVRRLQFCVVCALACALLALWEYVQFIVWGYAFDPNDVVASGVGATLAAFIAGWCRRERSSGEVQPPGVRCGGGGDAA